MWYVPGGEKLASRVSGCIASGAGHVEKHGLVHFRTRSKSRTILVNTIYLFKNK